MTAFSSFVLKETRHILRDRQTLTVLLLMPVALVLLLGYAIRTDVQDVAVIVVDPSRDARSAELVREVASTTALEIVGVHSSITAVEPLLRAGEADAALVLPVNFARRFQQGRAEVLIVSDGINANYAATVESYLRVVVQTWAAEKGGGAPVVRAATRMRFNPTLESENLFVPGLLAFVITLISALMTAISLAKEKETGTMEVLLVSPLRPLQIVIGKVAPYLVLAFVNALSALAGAEEFDRLLAELEDRVDDNTAFFVQLDKQAAFRGEVGLGEGLTFRAKVEAYPAKKEAAVENARETLERAGLAFVVGNHAGVMGGEETRTVLVRADSTTEFEGSKSDLGRLVAEELAGELAS